MPWHKPRFRLIHLVALVAVSAIILAAFSTRLGLAFWSFSVVAFLVAAYSRQPTKDEWAAIAVILAILVALLVPALQSSHHPPRKPRPSATSGPSSGKI